MRLQEIIKHGIFYHCDDFAKFQVSSAHNKKAIVDAHMRQPFELLV